MESDNSDQSSDELSSKRPKMETASSTSSKPESKDPFLSLPSDILAKIIGYIPVAQWTLLESLDPNFRSATWIAWRHLRSINLYRELSIKHEHSKDRSSHVKSVESVLHKLAERSPFLTSLNTIDMRMVDAQLNSDAIHALCQLEHLQSITLGDDADLSTDERRGIPLESVVEFLESTRSRTTLTELILHNVEQRQTADRTIILDRFSSSFVNGKEIQSPLKLEKFSFASLDRSISIRLDTMDTSRLTDVRVGEMRNEPDQLTNLIERSSKLRRIELSFLGCPSNHVYLGCNGPRLEANKKLLTALASHESLTTIKFERVGYMVYCNCMDFRSEFIEMLKSIGRRGKLRKLAMEIFFLRSPTSDRTEICATICQYIPYLQSIKLHSGDLKEGSICDIFNLTELEEVHFFGNWNARVTENVIKKLVHLPRLKRLCLNSKLNNVDKNTLESLSSASALMDLRIGDASSITGEVLEIWSDGFASNLEILMLRGTDVTEEHEEEGLVRLLEKASQLRVLIVEGYVSEFSLIATANSCPELEALSVAPHWIQNNIQHLQDIADRCPKLRLFGGFGVHAWKSLQFPKYQKISVVDIVRFWADDFGDGEYD